MEHSNGTDICCCLRTLTLLLISNASPWYHYSFAFQSLLIVRSLTTLSFPRLETIDWSGLRLFAVFRVRCKLWSPPRGSAAADVHVDLAMSSFLRQAYFSPRYCNYKALVGGVNRRDKIENRQEAVCHTWPDLRACSSTDIDLSTSGFNIVLLNLP